ncbi:dTDP-glucose 4,6-dehydratase [Secundilactobacillus muriivasis]
MRLLVTGGAGFIGSNFIRQVLATHPNDVIINLDKLTYAGNLTSLVAIADSPRYHFIQADINDVATVQKVIEQYRITHVVNFAAESHVDRSLTDSRPFYETNVLGVLNLLQVIRTHPEIRFLQVSTDEVYGDQQLMEPPVTESGQIKPSSPYAASKAAADLLVLADFRSYGLNVGISRSANNYGPYQHPEKLIPKLVTNGLREQPLPIYGSGENRRDWLFVLDNCTAIYRILRDGQAGRVYNVAAHQERTNNQVSQAIITQLGLEAGATIHVSDRLGHDLRYAMSSERLTTELGWQPTMSNFEIGLQQTIVWYKQHASWWQPLVDPSA